MSLMSVKGRTLEQSGAHARGSADAHEYLFTVSSPGDPPQRMQEAVPTLADTSTSSEAHISADMDTENLRAPDGIIHRARLQTNPAWRHERKDQIHTRSQIALREGKTSAQRGGRV